MLTLIVRAGSDPDALAETLVPLIGGVVKGLIGRSIIVESGRTSDAIARVADEAGADMLAARSWPDGLADAQKRASSDGVLVVDAGVIAGHDFIAALERHLRGGPPRPDRIVATRVRRGLPGLIDGALGRLNPAQIAIAPRELALGALWGRRYGSRLTLLEATSHRLSR